MSEQLFGNKDLTRLSQRKCSEIDAIRWCADNIESMNIDLKKCPSPMALTLVKMCWASPVYKEEFVSRIWTKLLPSKAQLDMGKDEEELDGKEEVDLIDKLLSVRDIAIKKSVSDGFENTFAEYVAEEETCSDE